MLTAVIVVVILMTPVLLPALFRVAPSQAQLASLLGTLALCISTVIVGAAIDRFGISRIAVPMFLLLIASTYMLYKIAGSQSMMHASTRPGLLISLYALAGFGAGAIVVTPVLMIRSFPSPVRFSGVSFSYNFGYALFGGVTPLLVSLLIHFDRLAPVYYVAAVAVIGLSATITATKYVVSDVAATVARPRDPSPIRIGANGVLTDPRR